jgi:hypothetical protein
MDTGHRVGIDVFSVTKRKCPMGALDNESVLLVQTDRHLVIGIDRKFEAQQVKPIVGERDGRLQKCRADALVMPLVVNCHSDIADVGPSWARDRMNSDLTDDSAINHREQHLSARLLLREKLAPCFCRREWNLKRAGDRLGRLKYALNGLEITRLSVPNDDAQASLSNRRLDVRLSIVDRISLERKCTAVFGKLCQFKV